MGMSVWSNIGQFFDNLWTKFIKPAAKTAKEIALAFFSAAIEDAANILGSAGLKVVSDAVTAAEQQGGTSGQKFAAASSAIKSDLAAMSIAAPAHIINAAIEAAVSHINAVNPAVNDQEPAAEAPTVQTPPETAQPLPISAAQVTPHLLDSAIKAVLSGNNLNEEASNLVIDMRGQGLTISFNAALDQLTAAVNAQSGR